MRNSILFIEWKSFGNPYIQEAFRRLGFEIDCYELDTKKVDTRNDLEYTEKLVKHIIGKQHYFVFSFNYYPIIAIACKACRIPYVSWIYDSPFIQLFSETLSYDTNFAFIFDNGTCRELEKLGLQTYYLPMAAPMNCYRNVWQNKAAGAGYSCDISFVGSLYNEEKSDMYHHLDKVEPYEKGFLDALIKAQKNIYGYNFLEKVLMDNPEIMKKIQEVCPVYARGDGLESAEWTLANYFLARKVTALERTEIVQMLGEQFGEKALIHMYTPGNAEFKGVHNMGKADYHTQAPHIFANSKINLNVTLRSIQTGIPLRAFDIMGCGGFLLTNYQDDYLEHFEPDEDLVIYYGYEDLVEKVRYYLEHESERVRIAQSGYKKIASQHTYLQRARTILDAVKMYWE